MSAIWVQKGTNSESDEVYFHVVKPLLFGEQNFIVKKFVNIVSILGLARTGKSTLMNNVVGKGDEEVFDTSDEIEGCTQGVWVSNTTKDTGSDGVTIYVDTEGQGNESEKTDYKLLLPVLLLSKVIIFNIKGRIAVTNVLDELALLVQIGDRIESESVSVKFGHLIIAVRDYDLNGTAEQLKKTIFDIKYKENVNIEKKNGMRLRITSSFKTITVILFPNYKYQRKHFEDKVNKLKEEIAKEVSEPHSSIPLTPQNINETMEDITKKMKENNSLDVDSLVESIQRKIIDQAYEDFEKNFSKECDEIPKTGKNPTEIKNNLVDTFNKDTEMMYLQSKYRNKVIKKIDKFVQEKLSAMEEKNQGSWIPEVVSVAVVVVGTVTGYRAKVAVVTACLYGIYNLGTWAYSKL